MAGEPYGGEKAVYRFKTKNEAMAEEKDGWRFNNFDDAIFPTEISR